ncbi:MAG: hypothetical protein Q8O90_08845, partial [Elusimicrobiota bacterium]|nr:hypothetical protein [Elusimicrobiota bacterium]
VLKRRSPVPQGALCGYAYLIIVKLRLIPEKNPGLDAFGYLGGNHLFPAGVAGADPGQYVL